ncbi:hypothetical protein VFPPC_15186 [Pochonia chlamydosporia 170]|uniref:Uncharacterized protein n=1 Tax=Pochonia chlamydosporia 170 TaxID=1380566 RepID=A0A179G4J4_METCM|nr:hypothetical protein VFPPC_15186 [Pochonia chlamydosporia 170]OAQ72727.1 hypothetical protein VFPPC_15186 [Pochonia chlamydosporia 170]
MRRSAKLPGDLVPQGTGLGIREHCFTCGTIEIQASPWYASTSPLIAKGDVDRSPATIGGPGGALSPSTQICWARSHLCPALPKSQLVEFGGVASVEDGV